MFLHTSILYYYIMTHYIFFITTSKSIIYYVRALTRTWNVLRNKAVINVANVRCRLIDNKWLQCSQWVYEEQNLLTAIKRKSHWYFRKISLTEYTNKISLFLDCTVKMKNTIFNLTSLFAKTVLLLRSLAYFLPLSPTVTQAANIVTPTDRIRSVNVSLSTVS